MFSGWPQLCSWYKDLLWTGQTGVCTPLAGKLFCAYLDRPRDHPAFCTVCSSLFLRARVARVWHWPHTSFKTRGCGWMELYFYSLLCAFKACYRWTSLPIDGYNEFLLYTCSLVSFMDLLWKLAVFPFCLVLAEIQCSCVIVTLWSVSSWLVTIARL